MCMSEFYIGYLSSAPLAIRRRVRLLAAAMVVFAVGGAALFAASQNRFAASIFDYGKPAEFSGSLVLQPYPALLVNPEWRVLPKRRTCWSLRESLARMHSCPGAR